MKCLIASVSARFTLAAMAGLGALAIILALQTGGAFAQDSGPGISSVDCAGEPEVVAIVNGGEEAQDFSGWSLVSDPVDSEAFDLGTIGELASGVTVNIQSGPGASGVLIWSEDEVFRDDDASDFVRMLDNSGATVDEVACEGTIQDTPTPTAEPTPQPDDVPNGGGPLAPSSGAPTLLIFAGAGMSAAALVVVAFAFVPAASVLERLPRLRRRSASRDAAEDRVAGRPVIAARTALVAALGLALLLLLVTVAAGARERRSRG